MKNDIQSNMHEWQLNQYESFFGDIIFPTSKYTQPEIQNEISILKKGVTEHPQDYMYSQNGISWKQVPVNISKIPFDYVMIRRIPDGITVGVSEDIKENPHQYLYSPNNGFTWYDLCCDDEPSGYSWIYHGNHDSIWFQKY